MFLGLAVIVMIISAINWYFLLILPLGPGGAIYL